MPNQDYDPYEDQPEKARTPDNTSDSPPQTAGMPDTQRDQSESFDRQNKPEGWLPGQQSARERDDSDEVLRGEQLEDEDQSEVFDDPIMSDEDY